MVVEVIPPPKAAVVIRTTFAWVVFLNHLEHYCYNCGAEAEIADVCLGRVTWRLK